MFKITLRDARELSGYSIKEIANYCSLTEDCYREYEDDFGKTPARIAFAICSLLKISLDRIHIAN
jgi:DNA-binding XRE family transcriptional regulator